MHVLVVSEDRGVRDRAVSMLRPRPDVEVEESTGAADARRRLRETEPDVLIVDGDLAPQGGFSFLYELRDAADLQGVAAPPSLVLTARGEDVWLAGWARATATLPKPVDPFAVAKQVDELVGG